MPSWRVHQSKNKTKRQTRMAWAVLGCLLLLLFLYQSIKFFRFLQHPLNTNEEKKYSWDGHSTLNLVFKTNSVSVFSYNPEENTATLISIPANTYIDVPGGFGMWQVRSIYDLGKSSKVSGDKLLEESISSFLGIPIDGFSSVNLLDELRGNLFSGVFDINKIKSDLTPLEIMHLKMSLMGVRFDKVKQLNLEELGVLDKEKLPDSTEVFVGDAIRLDSLSLFHDSAIQSENLSVSLFNATDRPGLAQEAKRLITNLGGDVVATQNAPKTIKNSYVEGADSQTLERLHQMFSPHCGLQDSKCDKIPLGDLGTASSRAQIVVVLGEDFP